MCLRFFRIRLVCSVEISSGFVFSFIFFGIYLFNKRHRLHNLICLSVLISNSSFRYADLVLWCVDWGPSTQKKCCCTSLLLCYSLFQVLLLIRTTISFLKYILPLCTASIFPTIVAGSSFCPICSLKRSTYSNISSSHVFLPHR